jgi:hypothetical protein
MTNLEDKNCGLCAHFITEEDRYLDRSFEHYCIKNGKKKFLGGDSFPARQNVCRGFLKKIDLDRWSAYPMSVLKVGKTNVVLWNDKTEEAKVLPRDDAVFFIREVEAKHGKA